MEIRDALHGSIPLDPVEASVIDSPYFQRLRLIKQLGFAETAFPSATHNRYIHSLGAMHVAGMAFGFLFSDEQPKLARFKRVLKLAALLHDIGHGPLSHTSEAVMPYLKDEKRRMTHEDYTLKIILDSELTQRLETHGKKEGFKPIHVAALIDPELQLKDDFFKEKYNGEVVDFRPLLQQLISSELDCDRMDYLRRDSHFLGVSYGEFDFTWLISNLCTHTQNGKLFLALKHRAVYAFEDFLISRFHMFLMIYFHHKSVIYDRMLMEYFKSKDCDYVIPADLNQYLACTDADLMQNLQKSINPWAQRIIQKKPYSVLIELPSGLSESISDVKLFHGLEQTLKEEKIHYLKETSTSEFSKYMGVDHGSPIYVRYDNFYNDSNFIPLMEYTDLFDRYKKRRSVSRLYVSENDHEKLQRKLHRQSGLSRK